MLHALGLMISGLGVPSIPADSGSLVRTPTSRSMPNFCLTLPMMFCSDWASPGRMPASFVRSAEVSDVPAGSFWKLFMAPSAWAARDSLALDAAASVGLAVVDSWLTASVVSATWASPVRDLSWERPAPTTFPAPSPASRASSADPAAFVASKLMSATSRTYCWGLEFQRAWRWRASVVSPSAMMLSSFCSVVGAVCTAWAIWSSVGTADWPL